MAIDRTKAVKKLYSPMQILNDSWDDDTHVLVVEPMVTDGTNLQRQNADALATKITTPLVAGQPGPITYIGIAAPGTAQSTAKWQCKKIDSSVTGTTTITWADSGNFSQTATDLTSLTYS